MNKNGNMRGKKMTGNLAQLNFGIDPSLLKRKPTNLVIKMPQ
jgi:hypothetical protein